MRLDLHLHSTASDGALSPEAVVEAAVRARLDVIALSDHDTTAGVARARKAGRTRRVQVIPAIEMSTTWEEGGETEELHILGYFVDPRAPELVEHAHHARHQREERMKGMVELLEDQGVEVSFSDVLEAAGPDRHSLARPHLARAMVEAGHVADVPEAFRRYIGDEHPAYLPTRLLKPEQAVEIIRAAGGVAVWAHPPVERLDVVLPRLVGAGLRGLEVYRPRTPSDKVMRLEREARTRGLVTSGGSDWHGPDSGELGQFWVTGEEVADLLAEGGI